jgi:acyl carrier protein
MIKDVIIHDLCQQGPRITSTPPCDFFGQLWCYRNTLKIFTQRHTAGRIAWSHANAFQRIGGLVVIIGSLTSSDQTTAIKEVVATDVRALVANHLGVSIERVTDEAHFTDDLGADWLGRLELMTVVEDHFAGVEISDADVDRIEVVGDLIRHIETVDNERRRRGAVQ